MKAMNLKEMEQIRGKHIKVLGHRKKDTTQNECEMSVKMQKCRME